MRKPFIITLCDHESVFDWINDFDFLIYIFKIIQQSNIYLIMRDYNICLC